MKRKNGAPAAAWSISNIVFAGLGFRAIFLIVGIWLDGDSLNLGLNFTDVDYEVFSDAGRAIYSGGTPYARPTYRYPPLFAILCIPNHYFSWPLFGKILFLVADALMSKFIYNILLERCSDSVSNSSQIGENSNSNSKDLATEADTQEKNANYAQWWALVWAFNPLSTIICTRGNADSLTNMLILMAVLAVRRSKQSDSNKYLIAAGAAFGLAIHLRLYPIIYAPAFWLYLTSGRLSSPSVLVFLSCALATFVYFGTISYWIFGNEFLQNAYLYHANREDPRHNFSVYFLDTYLKLSARLLAGTGGVDTVSAAANTIHTANTGNDCNSSIGSGGAFNTNLIVAFIRAYGSLLRSFLPQIFLIVFAAIRLAEENLCVCLLVQTMIFVAFNKVVTAQYFTWYLCLIPVCVPRHISQLLGLYTAISQTAPSDEAPQVNSNADLKGSNTSKYWSVVASASAVLLTMCLWLHRAYAFEILGENTFLDMWLCGVLFHIAQVAAIVVVLYVFVE